MKYLEKYFFLKKNLTHGAESGQNCQKIEKNAISARMLYANAF